MKSPLLPLILFLSACKLAPDYQKPDIEISDNWKFFEQNELPNSKLVSEADAKKSSLPDNPNWWEYFNDPVLNDLINQASTSNLDIKIAAARLKQSRANTLSAYANLLPQVNGTGSAEREKSRQVGTTTPFNDYQAGFDAAWEVDIFGGNRRREEAAEAEEQAAEATQNNASISIRAEVARNYIEVRNYQSQVRITIDNIKSQGASYNLTKGQFQAGTVSELDVSQAETIFNNTKARLPALETALETAKNNISLLLGQEPGKLDAKLDAEKPVPTTGQKFIITTPVQVINQRPDIQIAERQLAAATALQGAALAAQYPNLSLSAFFGYDNNNLKFGPTGSVSPGLIYSLGATTLFPLIDFGRVRSQINLADAEQEEALANYQKSVYSALGETQTDLVNYANEEKTYDALTAAEASSKKAVEFSKVRYDSGVSAFTDVLIAQRDLYTAQSQLADSKANLAKDLIAINKSLGR